MDLSQLTEFILTVVFILGIIIVFILWIAISLSGIKYELKQLVDLEYNKHLKSGSGETSDEVEPLK